MNNGFFCANRNAFDELRERLPHSIAGRSTKLMEHMCIRSHHEDSGEFQRGDIRATWKELTSQLGYSEKELRKSVKVLTDFGELSNKRKSNKLGNVYHINNIDAYDSANKKGRQRADKRADKSSSELFETQGFKKLSDEKRADKRADKGQINPALIDNIYKLGFNNNINNKNHESLSSSKKADDDAEVESFDLTKSVRQFLERVDEQFKDVEIAWGKDTKMMKNLIQSRHRKGIESPDVEVWDYWTKFMNGEVDEAFTMRNRAKDIASFVGHYSLLLQGSKGVKSPAASQMDQIKDRIRARLKDDAEKRSKNGGRR